MLFFALHVCDEVGFKMAGEAASEQLGPPSLATACGTAQPPPWYLLTNTLARTPALQSAGEVGAIFLEIFLLHLENSTSEAGLQFI